MECGTRKLDQIEADPALLKYLCPKLSIQPLLENAIYHGMEGMYEDGEITIRIYDRDGDIGIDVADNGPGMTQETIDHIMHNKVISSKRGSGIGVRNVNERIQLIYGEDYGVTITSELDEGTTATITIPKKSKKEQYRLPVEDAVLEQVRNGEKPFIYVENTYRLGYESMQMLEKKGKTKDMKNICLKPVRLDKERMESGEYDALLSM